MLKKECINLNLKSKTKSEVIDELIDMLFSAKAINSRENFKKAILDRENQSSTGLEEGIAIPHGKSSSVITPTIAFGRSTNGIDYKSLDGEASKLFFMIAAPENASDSHIEILSKLSTLLLDDNIRKELLNASSKNEVLNILNISEKTMLTSTNNSFDVIAVTACPTGIAHTYIAAEALMKKANELGISIKVETNGSTGVKNLLTNEDIKNAKGVIIAADKSVEVSRFNGKHVEFVGVKEGIKNPELLIKNALNQTAPIFKNKFTKEERETGLTNYIMGASFITEGAIPFAAADPIRVIPSCILGSALAGGLSMFFKCQLPAPHGGLFILPIIKNPIMYLLAIILGSFLTCVLLGMFKRKIES